ncbi:hypothetical protein Lalb_Chr04g0256271 [Lupinus albus]|uniref:Pentatricopeptide n=1 Tax=Lupinus albus TaxID=3870 RepID=A0A6A4QNN3_LUPAL|nr:hypothetical protein Lalb_Chr04g0256271 [Lupinus albus]
MVGAAHVGMYSKCGSCHSAFGESMEEMETESAFEIFDFMLAEMVQPNSATFVSVLSDCTHMDQVDRGLQVFKMMTKRVNLGACKSYLDSKLGEEMATKFLEIESQNPAPLVVFH